MGKRTALVSRCVEMCEVLRPSTNTRIHIPCLHGYRDDVGFVQKYDKIAGNHCRDNNPHYLPTYILYHTVYWKGQNVPISPLNSKENPQTPYSKGAEACLSYHIQTPTKNPLWFSPGGSLLTAWLSIITFMRVWRKLCHTVSESNTFFRVDTAVCIQGRSQEFVLGGYKFWPVSAVSQWQRFPLEIRAI